MAAHPSIRGFPADCETARRGGPSRKGEVDVDGRAGNRTAVLFGGVGRTVRGWWLAWRVGRATVVHERAEARLALVTEYSHLGDERDELVGLVGESRRELEAIRRRVRELSA